MHFAHLSYSTLSRLLAAAALGLVLACGGGGGGSTPPPPSGAWGTAQGLETNLLSDSYYPQVAVDGTGRALVVWFRFSRPGVPADLWAKVYEPGQGWQPEGTIESMEGDARNPVVSVGGDGTFLVAWGQASSIWANRYIPGSGWSGPLQISTGTTGADLPALASDAAGNAIVAWEQLNASGYYEVQASRYVSTGIWSNPVVLCTSTATNNFAPQVAMDPAGNGLVAWNRAQDTETSPYAVCAVPYRAGAGWQIPASVPSLQAGVEGMDDAYGCSLAMSSAGAVLGWAETLNGTNYHPYARIWNTASGTWSAAATVSTALDCSVPQVGIDANGKVHSAWIQYSGTLWNDIYVASCTPTGTWIVSSQPVDALAGTVGGPSLSVSPAGSASLVWNQWDGTVFSIYSSRYEPSRGWNTPVLLETEAGAAYAPAVRLNGAGKAFATWYQKDTASTRHIYACRWN
ncbi:MAG: hypothetical protein LWW79_10520 [Holophagaceae bacterium]|nr:hypothetical protein [Holophagaceae bacterium]